MRGTRRCGAWLALVLAAWAGPARADGGAVVASGPLGGLRASVLVSPTPLRAGPTEWSVLLQDVGGAPLLDAGVELELRPDTSAGPARVVALRREASSNRLLYSALVELPEPGSWQGVVRVTRGERGRVGELAFALPVAGARGRAARHWRALALAPVALGLFALHQWLVLREGRRVSRRPRP